MSTPAETGELTGDEVAVIGYAGRFPGAPDVDAYWELLSSGGLGRVVPSDADLDAAGVPEHVRRAANYVNACYPLEGADEFDAEFFGISPGEAELIDPQQRLFLATAWRAVEHAGLRPSDAGVVGVFGGTGLSTYLVNHVAPRQAPFDTVGAYRAMLGNDKDFLATRVSYRMGLTGPSVTVQTACSTSLVAVHTACQSLLNGECDAALAGGVSVFFPQRAGYLYEPGMILSADGFCRPFDAGASGTVQGSGAGVVLLKPLAAVAAGETVHGVIRGSAVNNDGSAKLGFTAPNGDRQREVITTAHAVAGISPAAVGYVEAHGTGTPLGDPVEVAALTEVFRAGGAARGGCALGSVKANIGHLDAAAGIAGLIKVLLMLRHRTIVPQPNFHTPNPALELASGPFHVATEAMPLTGLAAITSTGIGGTNVHVVLAPPPVRPDTAPARARELAVVSAHSAEALDATVHRLAIHLEREPRPNLSDVAHVLQQGRSHLAHRRAVVGASTVEVAARLRSAPSSVATATPPVFFVFPGQGAQYAGMGHETYETEPVYRAAIDECAAGFAPHLGLDLRTLLFADRPAAGSSAADPLWPTELAQPALFATGYALAMLTGSWGVRPAAMIGHSIGEFVAACLAGVLTLGDALQIVALRGRLLRDVPPGVMAAVGLGERELSALLPPDVDLAAVNAADACVVSGAETAVGEFLAVLDGRGVRCRRLTTARAFHSALTERAAADLAVALRDVPLKPPGIPFAANRTGRWITAAEATDPGYWAAQLRGTVRFHDGIGTLLGSVADGPAPVFVELGPPSGLIGSVRRHPGGSAGQVAVTALARAGGGDDPLIAALGSMWAAGVDVDWPGVRRDERRHRIPVPGVAFTPRRHWLAPVDRDPARPVGPHADLSGWFYETRWRRVDPGLAAGRQPGSWLLIAPPAHELAGEVADLLRADGHDVQLAGSAGEQPLPTDVVRFAAGAQDGVVADVLSAARAATGGLRLRVVTERLGKVRAGDRVEPGRAPIAGLLRVLPQERPDIDTRLIDAGGAAARDVVAELLRAGTDRFVCLRDGARYVPDHQPLRLDRPAGTGPGLRERGVYLITGGTGRIGRALAEHLARTVHARLVLVSRTAADPDAVRAVEAAGGEVLTITADVAEAGALRAAVGTTLDTFGALHGVVHAAGRTGVRALGLVEHLDEQEWRDQLRAKVPGAAALVDAVRELRLDFTVLMSSTATVLGGPGLAAYAAANWHLDALACAEPDVTSVAWDFWQFDDTPPRSEYAMTVEQGIEAFGRIVDAGRTGPVIVSTGPLPARQERSHLDVIAPAPARDPADATALPTDDDDARRLVADVWRAALGVDEVGVDDNFFDLGGDSLIGLRVIADLERRFGTRIPAVALYEGPTVRRLAELLRGEPEPEQFSAQAERAQRRKQAVLRGKRRVVGEA